MTILHELNLICLSICFAFGLMVSIFGLDTMVAVVRKAFGVNDDNDDDDDGGSLMPAWERVF